MSKFIMEEHEIIAALTSIENDPSLITESMYTADTEAWPDKKIPFVTYHVTYLKTHPKVNPHHYLANLRLKLRRRS